MNKQLKLKSRRPRPAGTRNEIKLTGDKQFELVFSVSKSVGEDTSVVPLVSLPALGDPQEDEMFLPVGPELESLHLRQVDVSSEPFNGGGRVTKHFQLHVGIFFFIGKKLILRIFQELRCTCQTSRLQGFMLSGGRLLLDKNY